MRNSLTRVSGLMATGVFVIACGSGPAVTGAPTLPPVSSLPPVPSLPLGSFEIPSFTIPSFAPDPVIEQAIPDVIDGQPVTDVGSANFLAFMQTFGFEQARIDQFVAGMQSVGIDPASVGFGSATATIDDEEVELQVIRFPGGNAGTGLDVLVRLDEPDDPPTLTSANLGGKPVTVATDSDGDVEYYYVSGEWAWFLADATEAQAAVIFAALP